MTSTLTPPRRSGIVSPTLHVVGLALLFLVPGMLAALLIEWGSSTSHDEGALLVAAVTTGVVGAALWTGTRTAPEVQVASVYAAVAWTWIACSVAGALPYLLGGMFPPDQWDLALFESVSGYSATGSTVLEDIEAHGRGILMWRQLTQWYGGMGMVVLAVSVLPFLGVGGLQLISAEAPGPSSDRLTPRVSETAQRLWGLYAGITAAIALALFLTPGVGLYDAVAHALTTSSTGGFSPYNESIGHFDSLAVELIIVVGLAFCGVNFTLHWRALNRDLSGYRRAADLHWYLWMIGLSIVATTVVLRLETFGSIGTSLRASVFNVVTLASSGGFGNAQGIDSPGNFVLWVGSAQVVLLALMVIGGSIGSTAGGLKVFRAQLVLGHARRGLAQTRHTNAVLPVKMGRDAVPLDVVGRVLGFVSLFFMIAVAGTLALTILGQDLITSGSGAVSAMSNMGPALGEAGPTSNFLVFTRPARGVLMALMLIGRLEIFAILLMFLAPYRFVSRRRRELRNRPRRQPALR